MLLKILLHLLGISIVLIIFYKIKKEVWDKFNLKVKYLMTIFQIMENSKDIIYYIEFKPIFKYRYLSPAANELLSPNIVEESMKNPYTAVERINRNDYTTLMKKDRGNLIIVNQSCKGGETMKVDTYILKKMQRPYIGMVN